MTVAVEHQRIAGRREGADLLGRFLDGELTISKGERQRAALMQSRAAGRTRR